MIHKLNVLMSSIGCRDFSSTLIRLSRAIRGIGDPLIAAYARCYLMRVGGERFIGDRSFVLENVKDFLLSYHQVKNSNDQLFIIYLTWF